MSDEDNFQDQLDNLNSSVSALSQQKMDFKYVLANHINRISFLTTFVPKITSYQVQGFAPYPLSDIIKAQRDEQIQSLVVAVDFFEDFVNAYLDGELKGKVDHINTTKNKDLSYAHQKMRIIMTVLASLGLLLNKEVTGVLL